MMAEFEYRFFKPGEVLYLERPFKEPKLSYREVMCQVPARFGTFLTWPSKFGEPSGVGLYDVGVIDFSVEAYTISKVAVLSGDDVVVESSSDRPLVALHTARLIKQAIGIEGVGLSISSRNDFKEKHVGLASAAAIQHSVAYAVNKLLGEPFTREQLIRFLPRNYGEETSTEGLLAMEPSTGGIGAVSVSGGIAILGKELKLLGQMDIPEDLIYVLGVPFMNRDDYVKEMQSIFPKVFSYYRELDKDWSSVKENIVNQIVLPAMMRNDIKTVGDIVFDYTLNKFGDIQTSIDLLCPGVGMKDKMQGLSILKDNPKVVTAFVSSVGPNLVILTSDPNIAVEHFRRIGIDTIYFFRPDNKGATFQYKEL